MIRVKGDPVWRGPVTEKVRKAVTKLERVTKVGRPKRYETLADKQRAYRERKRSV